MIPQRISYRYAKALYDVSVDKNRKKMSDTLKLVLDLFNNKELKQYILDPTLSLEETLNIIKYFVPDLKGLSERFITLLIEKRRLNILKDVLFQFEDIVLLNDRKVFVKVETAEKIKDEELKFIENMVREDTGLEPNVDIVVNDELIAGAIVKYEGKIIDMSLAGRINRIKQEIK
ncbi:MAG: F-type H+-transporting ATPase subunit delta [Kosmotogales bacterium]|nr:F-type H+-transporting ATPase subunit delta [Kosmotogales bacterium]